MKRNQNSLMACLLLVLTGSFSGVYGQSTFATIQGIMQSNCSASGCHGGGNANVFDVTLPEGDLYDDLVNVAAANPAAAQKGNKIVDPGHPYNSFLLRKIGSNNFDPYIKMDDAEKNSHPSPLQSHEIELIRQWIQAGAQESGNVVNYGLIQDYYTNGGFEMIPVPQAPDPEEGFQVRYGPIFLAPDDEKEFMKKENLRNSEVLKISRMAGYMTNLSHHLLLFKFENDGSNERDGSRVVPPAFPFDGSTSLTGAWQNDGDFDLPRGTAFYWKPNTILDFDYHVTNKGQTKILPADFYMNIYYYDGVEEPIEMFAQLENDITLGNTLMPWLPRGVTTRDAVHYPGGSGERFIWMLSSHTHKYGTDYDMFLRNSDGTRGEKIYEGHYNEDYTFNQGFYDYQHPPVRYFEPLKKFNAEDGIIYEVTWDVDQQFVTFGLTTDEEMMLFTYLYTEKDVNTSTSIEGKPTVSAEGLSIFPNPVKDAAQINYSVEKSALVKLEVFDMLGKKLNILSQGQMTAGNYSEIFTGAQIAENAGVYFITLTIDGNPIATQKVTRF